MPIDTPIDTPKDAPKGPLVDAGKKTDTTDATAGAKKVAKAGQEPARRSRSTSPDGRTSTDSDLSRASTPNQPLASAKPASVTAIPVPRATADNSTRIDPSSPPDSPSPFLSTDSKSDDEAEDDGFALEPESDGGEISDEWGSPESTHEDGDDSATKNLSERLTGVSNLLKNLRKQDNLNDRVKTPFISRKLPSKQATVPEKDLELEEVEVEDLDAEEEGLALIGSKGTTLVASDSAKTPKIVDDKEWAAIKKRIIATAETLDLTHTVSDDKQTITLFDKGDERMSVTRQDKTLKLSSTPPPPTSSEQLIQVFLATHSKTCRLINTESSSVAAKLYQVLTDKGIKVTLSENVLQQLRSNPDHTHIAEKYLQKNPSQAQPNASSARPTGGSKVVPPAAPTSEPSTKATNPVTPKDEAATVPPPATAAAEEPKKKKPGGP